MTRDGNSTAHQIEAALTAAFAPIHLEIEDDSARHAGHAGAAGGGGHFNVTLVSAAFDGRSMLEQHRMVNAALNEFIGGSVHALGLRTVPAADWSQGEDAS
jgi:BolA protein